MSEATEKYVFSERWPEEFKAGVRHFLTERRRGTAHSLSLLKHRESDFYRAHVEVLRLCDAALDAIDEAFASPAVVSGRSNE